LVASVASCFVFELFSIKDVELIVFRKNYFNYWRKLLSILWVAVVAAVDTAEELCIDMLAIDGNIEFFAFDRRVHWENYLENGWTYRVVLWFIRVSRRALSFLSLESFFKTPGRCVSRKPWFLAIGVEKNER
jgi:hypothetical protein